MLKTRRQRSFWARIKLSIILFQTPRRVPDFNNFESKSRFLIFRNVDSKKKILYKIYRILHTSLFLHSLFYAYFLTKDFALWLFLLSLPFNFKDQSAWLRLTSASQQAKKNISQNRSFCQAPFAFLFYFLEQLQVPFESQLTQLPAIRRKKVWREIYSPL